MNRQEGDTKSQFSIKPEIMRRLWYLSFESTFAGDEHEREDKLNDLLGRANDQLYRFNKVSDNTARNNGSMMMNCYFQYLPRKYHISYQYTSTGFIVDVENFDRWLNSDTLQQWYSTSNDARNARELDTQAKLTEAITKLTEAQTQQKQHHGLLGWLNRRK